MRGRQPSGQLCAVVEGGRTTNFVQPPMLASRAVLLRGHRPSSQVFSLDLSSRCPLPSSPRSFPTLFCPSPALPLIPIYLPIWPRAESQRSDNSPIGTWVFGDTCNGSLCRGTAVENVLNNVCFPIFCAQELDIHVKKLQTYIFPTKKRCKKLIEPFSRKLALKFYV